jgi:hypothetical protein
MSELAFDEDGQHFQVPATVTRWRIRRFNNPGRPGGAQVVYGDDGRPLFLDVDTSAEEFRETVGGIPGRYRLDGIDVHGHVVDGVPPAYLMINGPTANGSGYGGSGYSVPPASSATEHALVEIARINGEAFKSVADKFGSICDALSTMVRAVDGAGLPRRAPLGPLLVDHVDQEEEDDDDDERNAAPPAPAPQATLATMLGQVMQMVQVFTQMNGSNPANFGAVMGQVVETAKVIETVGTTTSTSAAAPVTDEPIHADVVDMRAASVAMHGATADAYAPASARAPREATRSRSSAPNASNASSTIPAPGTGPTSGAAPGAPLAADPAAHFSQIMAALTSEEQAQVQYVVTRLSMGDLMQWYEQLARMTVADGVAKIRAELARTPMEHAA